MKKAIDQQRNRSKPVLLIDASIYIFQYYFSMPDHWFSEQEQWPTAAVYGYTAFLIRLLKEQKPRRVAACFDESLGQCFRNDIYPDYKMSRALPDEALEFQLQACKQVTQLLGINTFASDRYEADDLIGSLYRQCKRSPSPIAVLTRDKDLAQLLSREQDFLWDYAADQAFYAGDITDKFSVRPHQLVDYLALMGDTVDDIPGVPGIGAKTAVKLLEEFGSVSNLLLAMDDADSLVLPTHIRGAARIVANLQQYREQLVVSKQLATIVTDLPLIDALAELDVKKPDIQQCEQFCRLMGFPQLYQSIAKL